jgi:hypothetical protein
MTSGAASTCYPLRLPGMALLECAPEKPPVPFSSTLKMNGWVTATTPPQPGAGQPDQDAPVLAEGVR